jgi:ATP/maltotriose-dependent transcriptional regulator MalT
MTDAPEKIWAYAPTIFDEMDIWTLHAVDNATEYTRSDIAQAAEASMHNAFHDMRKAQAEADTLRAEVARLRAALEGAADKVWLVKDKLGGVALGSRLDVALLEVHTEITAAALAHGEAD